MAISLRSSCDREAQSETSLNQACLRDLRTTNPHDDKDRIEQTKGGLLIDSCAWILHNEQFKQWRDKPSSSLLWIRGDPGKGKTMLLCGTIDELLRSVGDNANISFFFCQAADIRINNATAVLRGLIYLLIEKQPSLLSHIRSRYDQAGKALFEDINAWSALSKVFTDILKDPTLRNTYLVIDALDECTTDLPYLLDFLVQESSAHTHVKWIVSSRNWPEIEERLDTATRIAQISLELNEVSVSEAVKNFIQHKVRLLARVKKYGDETRDTICRHLSSNSQGTFLWVALVCQDLDRTSRRHALKKLEAFPPGLNALYGRMIDLVRKSEDAKLCKRILAIMSIVYRPIALDELSPLIEFPDDISDNYEALSEIIAICGSFLSFHEGTITFVHQSAREFLLRETRNEIFPRGIESEHDTLFSRSLQVMFKTLRRDIFDIKFPGFPVQKITQPSPNPLAAVPYACVYLVDHLQDAWSNKYDDHILDERGKSVIEKRFDPEFETHPDSFSTTDYQLKAAPFKVWDPANGQCTLILEGHNGSIYSITWSQDGSRLASASFDKTVRIWYLASGHCIFTLKGHTGPVMTIAWSHHSGRLASGSDDNTVRIWDPANGQCIWTLKGHNGPIISIAWSHNGIRIASGSNDKTTRIWDSVTGQCIFCLEGHSDPVISVAWLQNGNRLASGSRDHVIRLWDLATGQRVSTLDKHTQWVNSIAWSQDGTRIASGSDDGTVKIFDMVTGHCISILEGHSAPVVSIAWGSDRSRLASASCDKTVRTWDLTTCENVSPSERHTAWVTKIGWSHDGSRLASASFDKTVRVWNPATGQCISILKGHSGPVMSMAWSHDSRRLASASGSGDYTVRVWDPVTGQCTSTLDGHSQQVNSIAWSQDGRRLVSTAFDYTIRVWDLATGQCTVKLEGQSGWSIGWSQDESQFALASLNNSVRILDSSTGQCASTLKGNNGPFMVVSWSKDGSRLASGSSDKSITVWDLTTGQCERTLPIHSPDFLQFDELEPNLLHTAIGAINLAPTGSVKPTLHSLQLPDICGFGLKDDHSWITYNGVNLLWLPVDYRPVLLSLFAISATTVAVCCPSGRVIFLALSELNPLSVV
ncbi:uncharacterized protein N7458_004345 [Penicillium daleae]|uniref:NACHT domain-containing protein n=1 Tax=Penicillium daleae TaxID=63821 RepID=A0AAD6G4W5_9EURO|nr:uncharacterized protein N7458_004345 [Penicillium daleae]KAJ5456081.1 hypothetical protein N7458_004345 [Penicillium daleae]